MKIVIAFLIAIGIGAASRWARIPSLAPQAIVGALLIVAMTAGYTVTDRCLAATPVSVGPRGAPATLRIKDGIRNGRGPAIKLPAAFEQPLGLQVESLLSLVVELLATNEHLRQKLLSRERHSGENAEQPAGTLEGFEK
jgi:XapX domain-containing protein